MAGGAKFCQSCGHEVKSSARSKAQPTEKPGKIIKPMLVTWVLLINYLPLQLNLTLMGGAVCGFVGFVFLIFAGQTNYFIYPFVYSAILFFIMTPLVAYFVARRTYDATDYRFYEDRLEYAEGFWTVERKVLPYRCITDLTLRKNVIQRAYGLGTIYISVPSMGPAIRGFRGIRVADVKDPERLYEEIQRIIAQK